MQLPIAACAVAFWIGDLVEHATRINDKFDPRRSCISNLVAHVLAETAVASVVAVVSTVVALGGGWVVGGLNQQLCRSCISGGGGGSSCSSRVNSSSTWWGWVTGGLYQRLRRSSCQRLQRWEQLYLSCQQ